MLVAISALEFDPEGHLVWDVTRESVTTIEKARRVNRVATLDGGAVFNDFGFSDADTTIELRWKPEQATTEDKIARFLRLYSRVRVSVPEACYEVVPELYRPGLDESRLRLLVARKLSE